jgi:NADH:ubiquinone oxidoreductase subunit 4 (subunit M)
MVLASLLLKIGCVGFYKFSFRLGGPVFKQLTYPSFSLRILGFFYILGFMLRFCDLKFMVACSSVVNMSPTFPLLLNRDSLSVYSSFLIIIGHGLISYFIFFLVRCLYEISQRKRSSIIKSIESYHTSFSIWIIIFLLANIGFPPLMTFIREVLFSYLFFIFSSFNFFSFYFHTNTRSRELIKYLHPIFSLVRYFIKIWMNHKTKNRVNLKKMRKCKQVTLRLHCSQPPV